MQRFVVVCLCCIGNRTNYCTAISLYPVLDKPLKWYVDILKDDDTDRSAI